MQTVTHLRTLKVTGDDAKTFLQGQLSNDINALAGGWQYSAYCSPKGRALAVFIVWEDDDAVYLLIEQSIKEAVLKRLRMYVMRSKVVFEEVSAELIGDFNSKAERFSGSIDNEKHVLHFGQRSLIVNLSSTESNADSDQGKWLDHDVLEGLPRVTDQGSELFIPQMLNLDLLNGISFKKGCYTGQEIVARMHYLGKLKQRSYVCKAPANSGASIGEKVVDQNGKTVGNVVSVSNNGENLLAALRFDNLDNGLILESGQTIKLSAPQPYEVNPAAKRSDKN